MKRISLFLLLLLIFSLFLCGCEGGFGSKYVKDPLEYGKWESYLETPVYLPESISEYGVNSYSYTLLAYMDICYEIFLDVSLSEEELLEILSEARADERFLCEREAYYADGYFEIIFEDHYEIWGGDGEARKNVGTADVEKIVYDPKTHNAVFVCFHANDTGVYYLDELEYFKRFSIDEEEYVLNLYKG